MQQDVTPNANSVDSFKSWLIDWIVHELRIDRSSVDPSETFLNYGMDSVQAMTMVGDIEAKLGLRLPPTLAWDYPDIETLSAHLADRQTAVAAHSQQPDNFSATVDNLVVEFNTLSDRDLGGHLNQLP